MDQSTSFDADGRGKPGRPKLVRPCLVTLGDELELKRAMEEYRLRSGRQFPTWSEILEVLRDLGYAKRVWRPVEPAPSPRPIATGRAGAFQPMGEDSATGLLCWFSRVETPAGF